jgi:glyoxylase-like metal-dependent hydrolase (beta-lactamase superfamily II)
MSLTRLLEAVGGAEVIANLNLFQTESTGSAFVVFEGELPDDIVQVSVYERTTSIQLDQDFYRVNSFWQPKFENFAFLPQTQMNRLVNGNIGYIFGTTVAISEGTLTTAVVSSLKRHENLFHPHILLKAALADSDLILADTPDSVVVADPVSDLVFSVDAESGLPTKLVFSECNPLARDTELTIMYSDWTIESGGILFPAKVELFDNVEGLLWQDLRTSITVDPILEPGIFDLPPETDLDSYDPVGDDFGLKNHYLSEAVYELGVAFPYDVGYGPPAEVVPGVNVLASAANSMVVATEAGVVVLESAGSEYSARLLIDAVEEMAPGRPITHLIQSHHHVDHAAGAREFISLTGASLVVGDVEFFASIFEKSSTICPLAPVPENLDIVQVPTSGSLTLVDDVDVTLTVYHTGLDPHGHDSIIAVIDTNGTRVVYEADWYNAGFGGTVVSGGPEALFQAFRDTGILAADCSSEIPLIIVPAHGFAQSLETSIAELEGLGIDLGCTMAAESPSPTAMEPNMDSNAPSATPLVTAAPTTSAAATAALFDPNTSAAVLVSLLMFWMIRR